MCFTPCIETHHHVTALLYLRKRKYNIRCKYSRAPFRSIIQYYIVLMIFRLCCYCCHSETSLSFNFSLSLSLSSFYSALSLYFCAAQFLKIFLSISLIVSSHECFCSRFFYQARCIFYVCTHVLYRAVYFCSLVLVSYVSVSEGCLFCTDISHCR